MKFTIALLFSIGGIGIWNMASAQQDSTTTPQYASRKEVLMRFTRTRHGYFGLEGGFVFDLGQTYFTQQGAGTHLNQVPMSFGTEVGLMSNIRFFGGYNFGSHYLELSMGQLTATNNFIIENSHNNVDGKYKYYIGYWNFGIRYFYALPFKWKPFRLLIGPEVGIGVQDRQNWVWDYHPHHVFESISFQPIFTAGGTIRLDMKVRRNLTLFCGVNMLAGLTRTFPHKIWYIYQDSASGQAEQTYSNMNSSLLNLNINFGLKLDFYSKWDAAANYRLAPFKTKPRMKRWITMTDEELRHYNRKSRRGQIRDLANRMMHGYFGLEAGIMLSVGPTSSLSPNCPDCADNPRTALYEAEALRFFAGFALPNHHFEITVGGAMSQVSVRMPPGNYFGGKYYLFERFFRISGRYYYRLPITSRRLRPLIGAELGIALPMPRDLISGNWAWIDYPLSGGSGIMGIAGGNIRLDIKLARNFTLFLQSSVIGGFGGGQRYTMPYGTTSSNLQAVYFRGSLVNVSFTVGFKFDFFDRVALEQKYQEKLSELNK